jgi:GTP-binding protein
MVDQVKIMVRAGNGGAGAVSFRREKFIPIGGPDGGDGGKGGCVYLETDANVNTLQDFAHNRRFAAGDGGKGQGKKMSGSKGEDIVIKVPVGTLVKLTRLALETDEEKEVRVRGMNLGVLGKLFSQKKIEGETWQNLDLLEQGMSLLIARGGKGGKGNVHFKGSSRTTPMIAEDGQLGESFEADLELKLLADVGLVGLPNAGKSTLLSVLSNARPKVADYEFTTLEPNLGVLKIGDKHLVIADIPGLIEGASEGKGLGIKFLRHIERTKVLIHLVPANILQGQALQIGDPLRPGPTGAERIYDMYLKIRKELKSFGAGLEDKKEVVVLSKIDLVDGELVKKTVAYFKKKKIGLLPISAATGAGIKELINRL